jgi:hypothetical protein
MPSDTRGQYQRISTAEYDPEAYRQDDEPPSKPVYDQFNPEPPATWKRVALIAWIIFLFVMAIRMRSSDLAHVVLSE